MKVSVIIPNYNQKPEYFLESIQSVINQTRKPDEIIIVDDGSESPLSMALPDAKKISIKLISNEKNMGVGYSRQRGVDEATGNYIAFLSSDDLWDEKYLETMTKTAKEHPNKILYCSYYWMDGEGKIMRKTNPPSYEKSEDFCIACLEYAYRNKMFVNFSCVFIPKRVFEKVQFDKDLRFGEDLDFLLRSMKHFEYYLVKDYLLKYRKWDNLTSRIRHKLGENNEKIIQEARKYWEEN